MQAEKITHISIVIVTISVKLHYQKVIYSCKLKIQAFN